MAEYMVKMRALIDQMANPEAGPYSSPKIALKIVEYLRLEDPDLLNGWLHEQAAHMVREMINARDRSRRAHVRATSQRSVFKEAAEQFEGGNRGELIQWSETVHVVGDGTRKRLAELTAEELLHVSERYENTENESRMMKVFLRAIAKKIGNGRVEDYFDNDQLRRMWTSLPR